MIVGYLRLCGFNVFRNTYKPLLAETMVEFWNRYYYYFKELLVNFFSIQPSRATSSSSPGCASSPRCSSRRSLATCIITGSGGNDAGDG